MLFEELLETQPLYLEDIVNDFGCLQHIPAAIKFANGKYVICNGASAKRDGIPIEDYVGLTAYDVGRITNRKQNVTLNAIEVDRKLCSKEASYITYKQVVLAHDRFVVIEEVCKRAVLGSRHQVAATLGCAHTITHKAHPKLLFKLYESYLPTQEALQNFLRYKKLDTLFEVLPTREELLTLIAMRDNQALALIAKQLSCRLSDVERYQARLREKLPVIGLDEVLVRLQWHDSTVPENTISGLKRGV